MPAMSDAAKVVELEKELRTKRRLYAQQILLLDEIQRIQESKVELDAEAFVAFRAPTLRGARTIACC